MLNAQNLSYGTKAVVYVLGVLHAAQDAGLMMPGKWVLTPAGIAEYDQITAAGFRPSPDYIGGTLGAVCDSRNLALAERNKIVDIFLQYEPNARKGDYQT